MYADPEAFIAYTQNFPKLNNLCNFHHPHSVKQYNQKNASI